MRITGLFVLCFLIVYTKALLCYQCRKCEDRFPANWTLVVNCSSSCLTEILYIHNQSRVLKYCGDRIPARELLKGSNEIINNEMRQYKAKYAGAHLYSCNEDYCNNFLNVSNETKNNEMSQYAKHAGKEDYYNKSSTASVTINFSNYLSTFLLGTTIFCNLGF
ncbi:hypothetical protein DLEV_032 [Diachasmimorpha longicaudata entomopoxvirus]|uniref:Uncharacterized protein n=1 Tax=Diachasmimorpha longicaudata entomopoxvirus TaxID=109981 RepID=A0A7R5WJ39_9POXV|nr:hypothetical protein QKK69_gp032 [Diachasmimorpha longicaudata entomopoxvirus]AKS26323.1 hypothetical protein DLEV_032 [Diachasmimorpha longicaudata entomopoxvirus]